MLLDLPNWLQASRRLRPGLGEVASGGVSPVLAIPRRASDLGPLWWVTVGERLDRRDLTAYRNRLQEIDQELDQAQSWNDPARVERIEAEREALLRELAGATGLGGRAQHGRARRARPGRGAQGDRGRARPHRRRGPGDDPAAAPGVSIAMGSCGPAAGYIRPCACLALPEGQVDRPAAPGGGRRRSGPRARCRAPGIP